MDDLLDLQKVLVKGVKKTVYDIKQNPDNKEFLIDRYCFNVDNLLRVNKMIEIELQFMKDKVIKYYK